MKRLDIGIDVSKDKLDICLLEKDKKPDYLTIFNKENSIKDFFEFIKDNYKNYNIYLGYEATSNYMIILQNLLNSQSFIKHKLINPYQLHHYFKYKGIREKTDKVDSFGIAMFISEKNDDFFKNIDNKYKKEFQPYITTLDHLKKLKVSLKNLMHSQKDVIEDDLKEKIKDIEREINKVKEEIKRRALQKLKSELPEAEKIANDIKGVNLETLLYILPVIADSYDNKTIKQIQSYFGLNPVKFESGSSVFKNPKISKRGLSNVRKILFMSAMSSIRFNEVIREKYNRLVEGGKNKKVALVACMSHILRAVYYKYGQYRLEMGL